MIYTINEARNVEEYRAEKAAREKAEQDKKNKQYSDRYYGKNKESRYLIYKNRADGDRDVYFAGGDDIGSRNRYESDLGRGDKYHMPSAIDAHRHVKANIVADRNTKSPRERREIYDVANRNMRRHPERWDGDKPVKPKTESTIFDNIEII